MIAASGSERRSALGNRGAARPPRTPRIGGRWRVSWSTRPSRARLAAAGCGQALGVPSDKRISNEVIDESLAGASTEEEIAGPGGLLAQLTKRLVERALEVELTDHVGYEPHQELPGRRGGTPGMARPRRR